MGYNTNRGNTKWHDSTVLGIIKNEKYKGDILQGETFTLDPISKRSYNQTIWHCVVSTKKGKKHCPYSKGIPEEAIELAFVESYRQLCRHHNNLLKDFIDKDTYDKKYTDLTLKLENSVKKRDTIYKSLENEQSMQKRLTEFRRTLEQNEILEEFDRSIFESIVDKVIVGGIEEDGTIESMECTPYRKIMGYTFI